MTTVTILLSAYNGEKYLAQQLDSILAQDFQDWQLIIRDDGSQDKTLAVIANYQQQDNRIKLFIDQDGNLGANKSFCKLINIAPLSDYYMFSDQDDVWISDKITRAINAMRAEGQSEPLLVYSDLYYCDSQLNIKSASYIKKVKISTQDVNYRCLIVSNFIPGCSMGFNHAFITLIKPMHETTMMYDYWLLLVASLRATIIYIAVPSLNYRRHKDTVTQSACQGILKKILARNYCNIISKRALQVVEAGITVTDEQKQFFQELIELPNKSRLEKLIFCVRERLLAKKILRKIWHIYRVCLT